MPGMAIATVMKPERLKGTLLGTWTQHTSSKSQEQLRESWTIIMNHQTEAYVATLKYPKFLISQ